MKKWFTIGVLRIISFAKEYWTVGLIPRRRVMIQKLAVPQTTESLTTFMEPDVPLPHPQPDKSAVLPSCFFKTLYYTPI
jgi:hypothetical protein